MDIFVNMNGSLHNSTPENLLWNTVVNDDEKAFEKLFELFYPGLCIYAGRYIEGKTVREDIVQDVFATLWEDRKKLSITTSVRSYFITAVKNQCLNYIRKEGVIRKYKEFMVENDAAADREDTELYLLTELIELLHKTLSELPDNYRIVFEMNRLEGKSFDEIAKELNISVRTAKRYKERVTEVLKKELQDYLPLLILFYPSVLN